MLKINKLLPLISIVIIMLLLLQGFAFADEEIDNIKDSYSIGEDKLYTMQRGEFIKEISGGPCTVIPLCIKELSFDNEAKFVKYHVETGETVERGQVLASFTIPSSDAELAKRSLAVTQQQKKYESGLLEYEKKIADGKAAAEKAETKLEKEIAALKLEQINAQKKLYQHEQNYAISRLNSQLADLREEYSKNVLTAPFDGVIRTLAVCEEGENVGNRVLVTIVDPKSRVISANNSTGLIQYNQDVLVSYGRGNMQSTIDGKVISSNTLFADETGLSLNSALGLSPGNDVILFGIKDKEMVDKVANAFTSSFRCNYINLSNVWLIPKNLAQKGEKYYYVETFKDESYRKTYFYSGGDNNKDIWMIEGIKEDAQIIMR